MGLKVRDVLEGLSRKMVLLTTVGLVGRQVKANRLPNSNDVNKEKEILHYTTRQSKGLMDVLVRVTIQVVPNSRILKVRLGIVMAQKRSKDFSLTFQKTVRVVYSHVKIPV